MIGRVFIPAIESKFKSQAPKKQNVLKFSELFTQNQVFPLLWRHFYLFCTFLKNALEYIILSFLEFCVARTFWSNFT